jgi:CheY-like chemotaxis protein
MNKVGPIVIIEDDHDDIELYQSIFEELQLQNEIKVFQKGTEALDFLRQIDVKPFLILSDINLQPENGFDIRQTVYNDPELRKKCIPYIFYTTNASPIAIEQAYKLSVQGIFQKPGNYNKWKSLVGNMVSYWTDCMSPRI